MFVGLGGNTVAVSRLQLLKISPTHASRLRRIKLDQQAYCLCRIILGVRKICWGAIATPSPPYTTTLALVELLPFLAIVFCNYRRSPIEPDLHSFQATRVTARTAKLISVNCLISPFRRDTSKSIHCHLSFVMGHLSLVISFQVKITIYISCNCAFP